MTEPMPNAGPYFVGPDHDCTYCGKRIRMYGSRISNVDDGEWHTCEHAGKRVGPALINGDFVYFDHSDVMQLHCAPTPAAPRETR